VHQPVMLKEAISFLNLKKGDNVLDATIGRGGHSREILERILPGGRLFGMDQDASSIKVAEETLKDFRNSYVLINENFRNIDSALSGMDVKELDAALFDIGISSYQIDDQTRGFGIKQNSKLDMRMDPRLRVTAYDIVNKYREKDLADLIERYGEERMHRRIARYIVEARSSRPIVTTHELASIVHKAIGGRYGRSRIDPATRTFQALRIAVNDELASLEEGLKKAISWLDISARICVISFHSLEDRIVKTMFKGYANLGILKLITKKPVRPSLEEVRMNPRSRSAKLRVAERI